MTYFNDPHLLGGGPSNPSGQPPNLGDSFGYPSPPVGIIAVATTTAPFFNITIPYPTTAGAGAVPPSLRWVTIANVSSVAILVGGQLQLGYLPPFTMGKFQVAPMMGGSPILLTAVLPSGTTGPPAFNTQFGTAYATWYENDPGGSYPCSVGVGLDVGSTFLGAGTTGPPPAGGVNNFVLAVEGTVQTIVVRVVPSGGTANGFNVQVLDLDGANGAGVPITDGISPLGPFQWLYVAVPTVGSGTTLTITTQFLLNGSPGGTFSGTVEAWAVAGTPPPYPMLSQEMSGAVSRLGLTSGGISVPAGGAGTPVVVPTPQTGTIIRVRGFSWAHTLAPGAVQSVTLNGTLSGNVYWRALVAAPAPVFINDQSTWLVNQSNLVDPTEGLTATNNASTVAILVLRYDILPYCHGTDAP